MNSRVSFQPTLVAGIAKKIDEMIALGQLVPGQKLVETELAGTFGVGRAPLREAIRLLAGDGVLEVIPNRGARVRSVTRKRIIDTLEVAGALTFMGLDNYVRGKSFRVSIKRLERISIKISLELREGNIYRLLDALGDYSDEIISQSHNEYVREVLGRIHLSHYYNYVVSYLTFSDICVIAEKYEALTAALRSRDAECAYHILRESNRKLFAMMENASMSKQTIEPVISEI